MRLLWFNLATDLDDVALGFTQSWISAVAQRVGSIDVITMTRGRVDLPENVSVHSLGKELGYSDFRRTCQFYTHLSRVLRRRKIDACFSHMNPLFSAMSYPLLKPLKIPLVTWYAHARITPTLKLAHFASDRMVASLETSYPYKKDKLVVLGQGINTDVFSPDEAVTSDSPPMILSAGRLSPVKDHPTLIKAISLLHEKGAAPFQVIIAGGPATPKDNEYAQSLFRMTEELGLDKIINFVPKVIMTEMPYWYRKATLNVNLTPTGSGDKVAWEAMACGKPCLASNQGFRETMGAFADLLLFPQGDAEILSQKIQILLSLSETERARMGEYLRNQVVTLHSIGGLADKIVNLCADLSKR